MYIHTVFLDTTVFVFAFHVLQAVPASRGSLRDI